MTSQLCSFHTNDFEDEDDSDDFCENDENQNSIGLLKYFKAKRSSGLVHCLIRDCKTTFKRWKSYNQKRHLKNHHASIYKKLYLAEIDALKKLKLMAIEVLFDAVELTTINGQPFAILNASSIKNLFGFKLQELRQKGFRMTINRETIAEDIDTISQEIREIIKKEVNGKHICLALDTCTKGILSVLAINIQFMHDEKVISRSLGVIEMTNRHTAVNMSQIIAECLEKYGIPISKVKACVTDNAENMVLTRKILNRLALGFMLADQLQNNDDSNGEDSSDVEFNTHTNEDEEEMNNIMNGTGDYESLMREVTAEFTREYGTMIWVNPIPCGNHTINLAIGDAMRATNADSVIDHVHELSKTLRTKVVQAKLRQAKIKIPLPPLNNTTRWNSEYRMVRKTINESSSVLCKLKH